MTASVHRNYFSEELREIDPGWVLCIAMEGECLLCNSSNAANLVVGTCHQLLNKIHVAGGLRQEDEIRERFKGIVDFVGNGVGQLPGGSQLFGSAQGIFGQPAVGNVGDNDDLLVPAVDRGDGTDR